MSWDVVLQKKQNERIDKAYLKKILQNTYPKLNIEDADWFWLDMNNLAFEVDVSDESFIMFHIHEIEEDEITSLFTQLSENLMCGVLDTTTGTWIISPPEG